MVPAPSTGGAAAAAGADAAPAAPAAAAGAHFWPPPPAPPLRRALSTGWRWTRQRWRSACLWRQSRISTSHAKQSSMQASAWQGASAWRGGAVQRGWRVQACEGAACGAAQRPSSHASQVPRGCSRSRSRHGAGVLPPAPPAPPPTARPRPARPAGTLFAIPLVVGFILSRAVAQPVWSYAETLNPEAFAASDHQKVEGAHELHVEELRLRLVSSARRSCLRVLPACCPLVLRRAAPAAGGRGSSMSGMCSCQRTSPQPWRHLEGPPAVSPCPLGPSAPVGAGQAQNARRPRCTAQLCSAAPRCCCTWLCCAACCGGAVCEEP